MKVPRIIHPRTAWVAKEGLARAFVEEDLALVVRVRIAELGADPHERPVVEMRRKSFLRRFEPARAA